MDVGVRFSRVMDRVWGVRGQRELVFPPTARAVDKDAFVSARSLRSVVVNEGLAELGEDVRFGDWG